VTDQATNCRKYSSTTAATEIETYFFGQFKGDDPDSPSGQMVPDIAPHTVPMRRSTPQDQRLAIISAALALQDSVFGDFMVVSSGFFLFGGLWMSILLCYYSTNHGPSSEQTTEWSFLRGKWPPLILLTIATTYSTTSAIVISKASVGLPSVVGGFGSKIAIRPGGTVKAVEISASAFILMFGAASVLWNHWGREGKLKVAVVPTTPPPSALPSGAPMPSEAPPLPRRGRSRTSGGRVYQPSRGASPRASSELPSDIGT